MAAHITRDKEYEKLPQELLNELSLCGVTIERSYTRFRLYDKLMLFPHVVFCQDKEFYLIYIPNSYAKKNWSFCPTANPRAMEYVAEENSLDVIFIFESDIQSMGTKFIAQCVAEKIHPSDAKPEDITLEHNKANNHITIMHNDNNIGFVTYSTSRTAISITDWKSILSPRLWLEKVAEELSEEGIKKVLKFSFHLCDVTKTDDLMYYTRKMVHKRKNVLFDNGTSILRSAGWSLSMTLPLNFSHLRLR